MIEPVSFEQAGPQKIRIEWKDGEILDYSARDLRMACPCATCVDETTGKRILDPDSVPPDLGIEDTRVVGRYALRFSFSDQHSTGIFPFDLLRRLGGG